MLQQTSERGITSGAPRLSVADSFVKMAGAYWCMTKLHEIDSEILAESGWLSVVSEE
jgi:hypothetical protein